MVEFLSDGPEDAPVTVALAHGAGAAMDTPFMAAMALGLGERGIRVVRFEFPFMAGRRRDGKRRPPDAAGKLIACWREVVGELGPEALVIGGKSMGGRIASMIADEQGVRGLLCLGYPFHPAGRPDRLRIEHLAALATPTLILQGERDALGARDEVEQYALSSAIRLSWLPDGDHSFKPRKASGRSEQENLDTAVTVSAAFVLGL